MLDVYQLIALVAVVLLVVQFLIMRYYVSSTIDQKVNDLVEEKIKRSNKKLMKILNATFEKYMSTPDPRMIEHRESRDPRMSDPRSSHRSPDRSESHSRTHHRSRHAAEDEDSIQDPVENDKYDDDSQE